LGHPGAAQREQDGGFGAVRVDPCNGAHADAVYAQSEIGPLAVNIEGLVLFKMAEHDQRVAFVFEANAIQEGAVEQVAFGSGDGLLPMFLDGAACGIFGEHRRRIDEPRNNGPTWTISNSRGEVLMVGPPVPAAHRPTG
jgi:hypothetical protein